MRSKRRSLLSLEELESWRQGAQTPLHVFAETLKETSVGKKKKERAPPTIVVYTF